MLVEGDDHNEPIADTARSILDGHIVLDRKLASSGHFPSIDVLASISRVADAVMTGRPARRSLARLAGCIDARADVKELVQIGAYVRGTNPLADRALALWPALEDFLQQDMSEISPAEQSWRALAGGLRGGAAVATLPPAEPPTAPGGGCRMTTKWLAALVRARQVQEDVAQRELAEAERRARRASAFAPPQRRSHRGAQRRGAELTVPAFVAAAVALQAAAATHAAAMASVAHAEAESDERRIDLRRGRPRTIRRRGHARARPGGRSRPAGRRRATRRRTRSRPPCTVAPTPRRRR